MFKKRKVTQTKSFDKNFLYLILTLTGLGIFAVADASAPLSIRVFSDKFFFLKQHLMWSGLGLILLFVFSKINYRIWEKIATPLFFLNIGLLILVIFPGIGSKFLGARRWLILGPVSIQPSEFIKLTLALYLAKLATTSTYVKGVLATKKFLDFVVPIFLASFLIMLQPDLGTTLVVAVSGFAQIFISGVPILHLTVTVAASALVSLVLILTSDYRKERLLTFLQETQDPLGKSYHVRQILISLGSGGLFGVGLGHSRQKYLFLPETATDSIFAVIAEEIGFVGASFLILLMVFLVIKAFKIASRSADRFSYSLASGIASWIGFQTFLNIGSMVSLVPLTGIPLPFFSYGGSSLISIMIACGILLNISRYAKT